MGQKAKGRATIVVGKGEKGAGEFAMQWQEEQKNSCQKYTVLCEKFGSFPP